MALLAWCSPYGAPALWGAGAHFHSRPLPCLPPSSAYNAPSFRAGSQLLSSLSGYAYTKRAWKKEVLELFLDPAFFQMDTSCLQ